MEINSIQDLWASAKNQLVQLRERCHTAEEQCSSLQTQLSDTENNAKEVEICNEMKRQELQATFEQERRNYEEQIFTEQSSRVELQKEMDHLRRDLQEARVTIDEYSTEKEIQSSENDNMQQTMTMLQLDATKRESDRIKQIDMEARLNDSLQHLQSQQNLLLESRGAHSSVLAQIAKFENDVILLQSRETELKSDVERARERANIQERRALAAEREAEDVVKWARDAEAKATLACVELNKTMEEVQNEAATILGLHTQAQSSLVEMREALALSTRREGQYRAKVEGYESEIAHLTHQRKMKDFERIAIESEMESVSALAFRTASHYGRENNPHVERYDPTWIDPPRVQRETETKDERNGSQLSHLPAPPSWSTHSDRSDRSDRSGRSGRSGCSPDSISHRPAPHASPPSSHAPPAARLMNPALWLDDTSRFIHETKNLLAVGETEFGLSPMSTNESSSSERPRVSWYPTHLVPPSSSASVLIGR